MFELIFRRSPLLSAGVIFTATWFIASCVTLSGLYLTTNGFADMLEESVYDPDSFAFQLFVISGLFGVLFYFLGTTILSLFLTVAADVKNKFHFIFKYLITSLTLPFSILSSLHPHVKEGESKQRRISLIAYIFTTITLLPVWLGTYLAILGGITFATADTMGVIPVTESITGTGSMHPTFPKGQGKTDKERSEEIVVTTSFTKYPSGFVLFGTRYFGHDLERGDIVTFANEKTDEITREQYGYTTGFVKRVVGLPGDTIELRSGIVYLNGKPFKEPYTDSPRSTFAEAFLSECNVITVPEEHIFVMGDNRKGSGDSREFGFVAFSDIESVLTLESQKGVWDTHWRDTSDDFNETAKATIDKDTYLELLNEKRKAAGAPLLRYEPTLEKTAFKRGEIMLKFDDLSYEASRSGYTMETAMTAYGYVNGVMGEIPSPGYYTAAELIENQMVYPDSQKFVLDAEFDEIGIAEVEGEVNGCPAQIVVLHYAGYVPPNYSQEDIQSWQDALSGLQDIQPGWASLRDEGSFYEEHKGDIDRINSLISQRISITTTIHTKLQSQQWLSSADEALMDQDEKLGDEIEVLANKLNSL